MKLIMRNEERAEGRAGGMVGGMGMPRGIDMKPRFGVFNGYTPLKR